MKTNLKNQNLKTIKAVLEWTFDKLIRASKIFKYAFTALSVLSISFFVIASFILDPTIEIAARVAIMAGVICLGIEYIKRKRLEKNNIIKDSLVQEGK
ncbi:hypothetical protein ACTL6P_15470 [Endozoicomonas acroporae]|uniref:hypothetical protein n=1 Tax=Endozoicomonas acroporae TaxID=1701104 RepID=UPI000C75D862|nr:hypothetical protein [Endozoicomonas acroporae]